METGTTRSAKGTVETVELSKLEQVSARRVAESKATVPHLYVEAEVAVGAQPPGPSVVAACAAALVEHRRLNGAYRDGKLELFSRVNIAIVLAGSAASQAPTIFDADTKSAAEIAAEIEALSARAAAGSLTAPELSGATFTVEDLSASASSRAHGVITPGQSATLTVAAPVERAAIVSGELVPARFATVGLACDARVIGLADAAAFLGTVKAAAERPAAS